MLKRDIASLTSPPRVGSAGVLEIPRTPRAKSGREALARPLRRRRRVGPEPREQFGRVVGEDQHVGVFLLYEALVDHAPGHLAQRIEVALHVQEAARLG